MARIGKEFHLLGSYIINRKFFVLILCICIVCLSVSCSRFEIAQLEPTFPVTRPKEKQVSPTTTKSLDEYPSRQRDQMRVVFIPQAIFQMGSSETEIEDAIDLCRQHYHICNRWFYEREGPLHTVSLGDYWIDQTEVSNAQYRLCVDAGVCKEPTSCKKGDPTYADPQKASHPVVCINWEEARNYCHWVGARLPTEAEWEYAFRGENRSIYPWGDGFDGNRLNYCDQNCNQNHADDVFDDGYPQTAPTGSLPSGMSWSGVLDMSGNVFEWVSDWFGEYAAEKISNPTGPIIGSEKLIRGCSWFSHPTYCRGASRHAVDPEIRFDYLGFRCASDLITSSENIQGQPSAASSYTAEPQSTGSPDSDYAGDSFQAIDKDLVIAFVPSDKLQVFGTAPNFVAVPTSNPPILDGTISSEEWEGAAFDTFAEGNEIRLMQAGDFMYLGLRAKESGTIAGNVFIQQDEQIKILHSSAALGTAKYLEGDQFWQKVQDFSWRCRSTSNSQSAQDERADFLLEEGWLAANARMGTPNELEYQIEIPDGNFRMAVVFIKAYPPYDKTAWPDMLEDDCIKPSPGGLPEEMQFSPVDWTIFELIDPDLIGSTEPTLNP